MHSQPTPYPNKIKNDTPITCRVIREFKREDSTVKNQANKITFRVEQWCKQTTPTFVKRKIYVRQDGSLKSEKIIGLNLEDLKWLLANAQEIADALQQ